MHNWSKTYNTIDEDPRRVEITEEEPSKVEEVEVTIENDV